MAPDPGVVAGNGLAQRSAARGEVDGEVLVAVQQPLDVGVETGVELDQQRVDNLAHLAALARSALVQHPPERNRTLLTTADPFEQIGHDLEPLSELRAGRVGRSHQRRLLGESAPGAVEQLGETRLVTLIEFLLERMRQRQLAQRHPGIEDPRMADDVRHEAEAGGVTEAEEPPPLLVEARGVRIERGRAVLGEVDRDLAGEPGCQHLGAIGQTQRVILGDPVVVDEPELAVAMDLASGKGTDPGVSRKARSGHSRSRPGQLDKFAASSLQICQIRTLDKLVTTGEGPWSKGALNPKP